MVKAKKQALGRGLSALMPDKPIFEETSPQQKIVMLPIGKLQADPDQPRQIFDEDKLSELAESIRQFGVMQPLLVTSLGDGSYRIIVGERRFRAAQMEALAELPCIISTYNESEQAEVSLIENIQRENLTAMEEAAAYRRLIDNFGYTQEQLAERLGKSRPYVANTLRLLQLAPQYQKMVEDGRLSAGHARALLSLSDSRLQARLAEEICRRNLSVRQAEALAKSWSEEKRPNQRKPLAHPAHLHDLEKRFTSTLGLPARLQGDLQKGRLVISYHSADDLENLIEKLLPERKR